MLPPRPIARSSAVVHKSSSAPAWHRVVASSPSLSVHALLHQRYVARFRKSRLILIVFVCLTLGVLLLLSMFIVLFQPPVVAMHHHATMIEQPLLDQGT